MKSNLKSLGPYKEDLGKEDENQMECDPKISYLGVVAKINFHAKIS
jgi:hypothetical protein